MKATRKMQPTAPRDRKRRSAFEEGKALGYYAKGAAKLLFNPERQDNEKVARKKTSRSPSSVSTRTKLPHH